MRGTPHPLDPIFDDTRRDGAIVVGNSVAVPVDRSTTGSIDAGLTLVGAVIAEFQIEFSHYWDFSNTANWTGALTTGQLPEVGSLAAKQIDLGNGLALSTINGLQCISNGGGFLSARGEFGTDASLPAVTMPYLLCGVYVATSISSNARTVTACGPSNDPSGSGVTVALRQGATNTGAQANAAGASTITATGAPAEVDVAHAGLVYVNGASSELWVDGVLEATGDMGNCDFNSGKRVLISTDRGADGGGPNPGLATTNSKWGEGGLAVGAVTTAQIEAWFDMVIPKWGI